MASTSDVNQHNDNSMDVDVISSPPDIQAEIVVYDRVEAPVLGSSIGPNENYNVQVDIEETSDSPVLISSQESEENTSLVLRLISVTPTIDSDIILSQEESKKTDGKCHVVEDDDGRCICQCSSPKRKKFCDELEDGDDAKLCPICFDSWTNSGEHRLCSLRCGHLFGHSCLLRWFQTQKSCPTCKRAVRKTDIRFIYARKVVAVDTTELEKIRHDLEHEKSEKAKVQMELTKCKSRADQLKMEYDLLTIKYKLTQIKNQVNQEHSMNSSQSTLSQPTSSSSIRVYMEKCLEICRDGGCRVMAYCPTSQQLAVSTKSPNPLFAGFGVRKILLREFRSAAFIPLHSKPIRDLSHHHQNEWLLSVSLDKYAKVLDMVNTSTVFQIECESPIWSCCWDTSNPNCFYVGQQQGSVARYDVRKQNERLSLLQIPGDMSPVVSLASTDWYPGDALSHGAVFVCKLNSCWAIEHSPNAGEDPIRHPLSLDSPFISMCFDNQTKHLLVSSRPNQRYAYSRHTVCTLTKDARNNVTCNPISAFQGAATQKFLSRSCLLNTGVNGEVLVAAHQEMRKCVDIWSLNSGKKLNTVPAHEPVLDLCSVVIDGNQYLASLNEKKLEFFKIEMQ